MSDPLTRPARAAGGVRHAPELQIADGSGPKRKGWLAATLPVAIIAAFAELALAIINNELTIYFPNGLGLDTVIMTNVMMPFFLSEILFKSPLGILADRWGRKPLMVIGPAISIFTPLALVAIHYPPQHIVKGYLFLFGFLRLLDGLGAAALWPAMFAYVGDHVQQEKRASAMSLLNVTYMLGLAFGFLAGGWANDTFGPVLTGEASFREAVGRAYDSARVNVHKHMHSLRHFNRHHPVHLTLHKLPIHPGSNPLPVDLYHPAQFHPSFYLGSVLFAVATIVAVVALKDRSTDRKEGIQERRPEGDQGEKITWQGFVEALKSVPNLMLIAFVAFAGIGCIMLLVKKFALDELGVSETDFGLLVLWPAVLIGALAVPLGQLSDKIGKVVSVRAGFVVAASGMWLLVVMDNIPHLRDVGLIAGASLLGIGFVIAFPAWMALLTMVSSESRRGTTVGAVSTAQGIGSILGVELGGWLYSHASRDSHAAHGAPFVASGIFLAIAAVLTFLIIRSDSGAKQPAASAA